MTTASALRRPSDFVAGYQPAHVAEGVWTAIAAPIRAALMLVCEGDSTERAMASRLAGYGAWLHREAIPVSLSSLSDLELIERYVAVGMPDAPDATRATSRALLRRAARRLDPDHSAAPRPIRYRRVRDPYRRDEVEGYLRAARSQPTVGRRDQALALLALGLACGLDSRDLAWVRGTDVARAHRGAVSVTVNGGTRPRQVIALAEYADLIMQRAAAAGDALMIGGTRTGRRNVTSYALDRLLPDTRLPPLAVGRLRSTWLLTHLNLGTPLPTLMQAAGLSTVRPLEDLLRFADPIDDGDAHQALLGQRNQS